MGSERCIRDRPHINSEMIDKRAMEAAGIQDIDELFIKPDPAAQAAQQQGMAMEMAKLEAEIQKLKAEAMAKVEGIDIQKAELTIKGFDKGSSMVQQNYDEDKAEMMPPEQQAGAQSMGAQNGGS